MDFKDKKIGILGLGEAGKSAAKYLFEKGAELFLIDDAKSKTRFQDIKIFTGDELTNKEIKKLDLIVVSPGIRSDHKLILKAERFGIPVVGELYLATSLWKGPIIGITGTNGKTTTTLLVSHILSKINIKNVVAGNISPPLFELMEENKDDVCAVLEISSFQLEYFPINPISGLKRPNFKAAVCLNIAPDHLDRHDSLLNYQNIKLKLFLFQTGDDFAIIGRGLLIKENEIKAKKFFLKELINSITNNFLYLKLGNNIEKYNLSSWQKYVKGRHNLDNLVAAIICARSISSNKEKIENAFLDFNLPHHRIELIKEFKGVKFIDDSKATNIHALKAALSSFKEPIILIAGGKGKGEDYNDLLNFLLSSNGSSNKIKAGIFIGEESENMAKCLKKSISKIEVIQGENGNEIMKCAVKTALTIATKGDIVLLSPACASFDLFNNYKERGNAFKKAVFELTKNYG